MDRAPEQPQIAEPEIEVDLSLLDWYLQLGLVERLRSASKSAATMERLRRAASSDR